MVCNCLKREEATKKECFARVPLSQRQKSLPERKCILISITELRGCKVSRLDCFVGLLGFLWQVYLGRGQLDGDSLISPPDRLLSKLVRESVCKVAVLRRSRA